MTTKADLLRRAGLGERLVRELTDPDVPQLDPTFIRRCMERIIPPGFKPEDYLANVDPIRIARLVVDEVKHQLRMAEPSV